MEKKNKTKQFEEKFVLQSYHNKNIVKYQYAGHIFVSFRCIVSDLWGSVDIKQEEKNYGYMCDVC